MAEVGIQLGLGSYIKPFVSLWGELVGISYVFLLYVVGEEDPNGFLSFCVGAFPMLRTLLPEVSNVVPFCVHE